MLFAEFGTRKKSQKVQTTRRRQLASTPLATDLGVAVCRPGSLDIQRSIEIEKETRYIQT